MFIGIGLYAIIDPQGITLQELEQSYTVPDVIRGWGIYSVTIGVLLSFPQYQQPILLLCFFFSIIWHSLIVYNNQWTLHHKQSIVANVIVIILICIEYFNYELD